MTDVNSSGAELPAAMNVAPATSSLRCRRCRGAKTDTGEEDFPGIELPMTPPEKGSWGLLRDLGLGSIPAELTIFSENLGPRESKVPKLQVTKSKGPGAPG